MALICASATVVDRIASSKHCLVYDAAASCSIVICCNLLGMDASRVPGQNSLIQEKQNEAICTPKMLSISVRTRLSTAGCVMMKAMVHIVAGNALACDACDDMFHGHDET